MQALGEFLSSIAHSSKDTARLPLASTGPLRGPREVDAAAEEASGGFGGFSTPRLLLVGVR